MERLHRLSLLPILIGPALAQISFPNCSTGWEWASIPRFLSIDCTPVSDCDAMLSVIQHLESKPVQHCRMLGGFV